MTPLRVDASASVRICRVQALVVGGAHEPTVLQRAYAATPGRFTAPCDVRILPGSGHWPHRENEEEFLEALLTFLMD